MSGKTKEIPKQTRVKKNQKVYGKKVIVKTYKIHKGVFLLLAISLLLNCFTAFHFISFNHNKVKTVTKTRKVVKEVVPENILFLGDSITYRYDLEKYFPDNKVVNSGVDGNTTNDILNDMKKRVYDYNPSKVFLLIGTNDLNKGQNPTEIVENIKKIVTEIKNNRKESTIYIESVYPVNEEKKSSEDRTNEDIKKINELLSNYCNEEKIEYIDIFNELVDENYQLKLEYTKDGLHISDAGYEIVTKKIKSYMEK